MRNFTFHNPTTVFFGRGQTERLADAVPADARVLMTYGGGSIKRNGVYDAVMDALSGHDVQEAGGIPPNPTYETLMEIVDRVAANNIDYLLAVGGGSVIDGTKFIAAAAQFDGDPWAFVDGDATVTDALPLGAVLTLPGTGSEMNGNAVISRTDSDEKLGFGSRHVYPDVAVLDPTFTFSLPERQTANGVVDAFSHVAEQYLTYPVDARLQDRFAESIFQTLIEDGPRTVEAPEDYEARANVMWAATTALNGLIGRGVPHDWATHRIGHELTALHGLDHARTLAAVMPSLLWVQRVPKHEKLLQYGARVWGIRDGSPEARVEQAIERTADFFASLGVPPHLAAYDGIGPDTVDTIVERFKTRGWTSLGERGNIDPATVRQILELSLDGEPTRSLAPAA
jgi:NADP-dependent alcohol dehydrogenase